MLKNGLLFSSVVAGASLAAMIPAYANQCAFELIANFGSERVVEKCDFSKSGTWLESTDYAKKYTSIIRNQCAEISDTTETSSARFQHAVSAGVEIERTIHRMKKATGQDTSTGVNDSLIKVKDCNTPRLGASLSAVLPARLKPHESEIRRYIGKGNVISEAVCDQSSKHMQTVCTARENLVRSCKDYVRTILCLRRVVRNYYPGRPVEDLPSRHGGQGVGKYGGLVAIFRSKVKTVASSGSTQSDEIVFWNSVKDSTDGAEFCAYLETYPNGKFRALANLRAKKLRGDCVSSKAKNAEPTTEERERTVKLTLKEMDSIHWKQQYQEQKLLGVAGDEYKGSATKQGCKDCATIRFKCRTGFISDYDKQLPKLKIAVVDWPTSFHAWVWISERNKSAFKVPPEHAGRYLKQGLVDCVATGGGKLRYDEMTAASELEKLRNYLATFDDGRDRSGSSREGIVACTFGKDNPDFANKELGATYALHRGREREKLVEDLLKTGRKNIINTKVDTWTHGGYAFLESLKLGTIQTILFYDRDIESYQPFSYHKSIKLKNHSIQIGKMYKSYVIYKLIEESRGLIRDYGTGVKLIYCKKLLSRKTCPNRRKNMGHASIPCE